MPENSWVFLSCSGLLELLYSFTKKLAIGQDSDIFQYMDAANTTHEQRLQDLGAKIEIVNDDIWEYTRLDLTPPEKLLNRRSGLRARLTKLQNELKVS